MLTPGQLVGNYRVVGQLGKGGMGAVYEAVHQYIGRRAAVKTLLPELSSNPNFVTRFLNEARAVNLVQHPGVVEIFEFGLLPDKTAYLIMEYLEGESIDERMDRFDRRLFLEAPQLCRQIALALQAAHDKDIVHRDLKPQNVMIVQDRENPGMERIKVLDFGIAKVAVDADGTSPVGAAAKTGTGIAMGTPMYMSPEQCIGASQAGSKSDVYSLGVMLYEMLTGTLPFSSDLRVEIMTMHVRVQPRPIRELEPEVSEEMAELVHRMLAKKPEDRPSMGQVAEQLQLLGARPSGALELRPRPPAKVDALASTMASEPGAQRVTTGGSMSGESSERPGLRRRGALAAVFAAAVLLGGGGALWRALVEHRAPAHRPAAPIQAPPVQPAPPPMQESPPEPVPAPPKVEASQVPTVAEPQPDTKVEGDTKTRRHGQRTGHGKSHGAPVPPSGPANSVYKHPF